ncbi:MAG: site-specific DNA-methyltransferase, partial [Lentisphaeria bacterium]|nr:site-specific DNA-methyltransferase [Lentisphaeria bacterium]
MDKLKLHSPNLTQDNIARIRELFPNCVTEAKGEGEGGKLKLAVDFDQLRQELSESIVEGPQERYHLNWPGKREALLTANAPIAKTLRPCREESVDFDTTKNLFIEGDNLDALKLLQETYLGKVKMIYIDPPYNTGNDFIYEDDFAENTEEFLKRSNQKDEEGNRLVANTEANGRFHSDWLSMMYPRLKLARNLLREDGVIFISIDDGEISNLKKMCNEIFGEDKFIAQLIWKSRQNKDNRTKNGVSIDHEYVIAYGKTMRGDDRDLRGYSNPDNDPRGDWTSANMVGLATADRRPNLHYDLFDPATGINYGCPTMGWRYDKTTMTRLVSEDRILWPSIPDGRPRRKSFLCELSSERTGYSSIIGSDIYTRNGTADIGELFDKRVMDFPKPVDLIKELINQADVKQDDIVLDFFSGSATTAHAAMKLNAEDGANRAFLMVQLPELCDEKSEAFKAGYKTIAEISKERIRRAGKKIKEENATTAPGLDIGFRVLKVDSSNLAEVYYRPDATEQNKLGLLTDNIKPDRTAEDLLFQVFLDWGVDL